MANPRDLRDKMQQEPMSEGELDDVRGPREGDRANERKGAGQAGREPAENHRRLSEEEGTEHAHLSAQRDESVVEGRRARGEFTSEGERTQAEEDFGERGLRTQGGPFDNRKQPSILDPEND